MHSQGCPRISNFAVQRAGNAANLELRTIPLMGGLENCGVFKIELTWPAPGGRLCADRFVVKRLVDHATRELAVWKVLVHTAAAEAMPAMYGAEWLGPSEAYLYQEFVLQDSPWPWSDTSTSVAVLEALAQVHSSRVGSDAGFESWNYESDLMQSAQDTVALFASAVYDGAELGARPMLRPLERVVQTLPAMRRVLISSGPRTLLHGDLHAGNAIIRNGGRSAVFLDWGRARFGSPLEDVSSWLQSVGFWEPQVRRRHDTLLRCYLRARNLPDHMSAEIRELYWIAAASNAMAGALRYNLAVLLDSRRTDDERQWAFHALQNWLRIVRRVDAGWRN